MKGGIGVLLRIDHPHERIDHFDESVDLRPVFGGGRIVVRQIDQHQAGQLVSGAADSVAAVDAQPVEQTGCPVADDRRPSRRGGGPPHADLGQILAHQGVEHRRLAAARGAGEGHDRVGGAVAKPTAGRVEGDACVIRCGRIEAMIRQRHHLAKDVQAFGQRIGGFGGRALRPAGRCCRNVGGTHRFTPRRSCWIKPARRSAAPGSNPRSNTWERYRLASRSMSTPKRRSRSVRASAASFRTA